MRGKRGKMSWGGGWVFFSGAKPLLVIEIGDSCYPIRGRGDILHPLSPFGKGEQSFEALSLWGNLNA